MKFTSHSIKVLKFVECFLTYRRHLKRRGLIKLGQYEVSGKLLQLVKSFLKNCKQKVVLSVKSSYGANELLSVHERFILDPIFFLIYINDISDDLSSNPIFSADDASLFSVIPDQNLTARYLNDNLQKIRFWSHPRKISLTPDPLKQVQEVFFYRKHTKLSHLVLLSIKNLKSLQNLCWYKKLSCLYKIITSSLLVIYST